MSFKADPTVLCITGTLQHMQIEHKAIPWPKAPALLVEMPDSEALKLGM